MTGAKTETDVGFCTNGGTPALREDGGPGSSKIKIRSLTPKAFYPKMCSARTIQSTHSRSGPAILSDNRRSTPVQRDSRPERNKRMAPDRVNSPDQDEGEETDDTSFDFWRTRALNASTKCWMKEAPTPQQASIWPKTSRTRISKMKRPNTWIPNYTTPTRRLYRAQRDGTHL